MSESQQEIPDLVGELERLLAQIPPARVTTYGRLADALGADVATRWVGQYLLHHDHHDACVCHRVVRTTGELGQYIAGGSDAKARRLATEGVGVVGDHVDLDRYVFEDFLTDRPLAALRCEQEALAERVVLTSRDHLPALVAGVDVSYTGNQQATAAYALVDSDTHELIWSTTLSQKVTFPYISSFLAFRELPILLGLIETACEQGRLAEIVLVDGSGILHPRRAGVASYLGVLADVPTIGVTKKLLVGCVRREQLPPGESSPISHEGQEIGTAVRSSSRSKKLIYVSPGHQVDVCFADTLVRKLLTTHRLPEPLYWADRLSKFPISNDQ